MMKYELIFFPVCSYNTVTCEIFGNKLFTDAFCDNKINELRKIISSILKNEISPPFADIININTEQYVIALLELNSSENLYYFIFTPTSILDTSFKRMKSVSTMEQDYISILEAIHDDFTICDANGKIINVLPNFESFYGISAEEVIGKTVYELEDQKIFNPSIGAIAIESKKAETSLQKTGNGKYLMCTAIPIKDSVGDIVKVISFSRDVTEYKKMEDEYSKLEKAIGYYSSEIDRLRSKHTTLPTFIGNSTKIQKVFEIIDRISNFDTTILLTGESGVGKTLYANTIHKKSSRANEPFIELNCGAIPENLFESELFGYEKGSFTGANMEGRIGWIERANKGTLFLDEIADMPIAMQVKLLKTLDSKKITRIAGTHEIPVDFRLIVATNKNITKLVENGLFREDLFFRLNVISISIPPLRDRPEDIFSLIMYFFEKAKKKFSIEKSISKKAIDILINYPYPGNIRELENTIERLLLTSDGHMITENDIPNKIKSTSFFHDYDSSKCTLPELLKSVEKNVILQSYRKHKNTVKVAEELGISQPSVSLKLKKYL